MKKFIVLLFSICLLTYTPVFAMTFPEISFKYTGTFANIEEFEPNREIEIEIQNEMQSIGCVVIGFYNDNDQIIDIILDEDILPEYKTIILPQEQTNYIKVFMWRSIESMEPIIDNGTIYKIHKPIKPKGGGIEEDPYKITNADELSYIFNDNKSYYILMNDIDLSNRIWNPQVFQGTFDGRGYSLTGINVSDNAQKSGFVSDLLPQISHSGEPPIDGKYIDSCIKNLKVEVKNSGKSSELSGGITAYLETGGSIINCDTSGCVYGITKAGGIVGETLGGYIEGCNSFVNVTVHGENFAYSGGIAGCSAEYVENQNTSIINCNSYGVIKSYANEINIEKIISGGIVGYNFGIIQNCASYAKMYSDGITGGIAGYHKDGIRSKIINCTDNSIILEK